MSCIAFCGWLCESYEIKQKRDKQITDWIDVCKCNQDQIEESKIYNGRMVKVYDENTVDILIKHTDRIEKYHMRLYDFNPIDKKNSCKILKEISDETMGLCSVYIVSENKQKRLFYAIICDRFSKDIRTRLIDKGIVLEPSSITASNDISSAPIKIKEHILQKMNTLPIVVEENDVAVVLPRDEPEPEHEVISKEIAVAPVELLRKSVTLPYIVEDEVKQEPLKKQITIPYIASKEVQEEKLEPVKEEPVEEQPKEGQVENPLRKTVTLPCIVEPDV